MFDLEAAVRGWRDAFVESLRAEDLEELEEHLRAQVAELAGGELSEEEAFLVARHRIGRTDQLEREFAKVRPGAAWIGRVQLLVLGILATNALLFGLRMVVGMAAWGASALGLGQAGSIGAVGLALVLALVLIAWGLLRAARLSFFEGRGLVLPCLIFALLGPLLFLGRGILVMAQVRRMEPVEVADVAVNQSYVLTSGSILLPLALFAVVLVLERRRRTA